MSGPVAELGSRRREMLDAVGDPEAARRRLDRLGAACGIAAVAVAVAQVVIEVIGLAVLRVPVPSTVEGWFDLLQQHRLLGLTELTGLQVPMFALLVPLYLALYAELKTTRPTAALVGTTFVLIGIAVYLSSNTAFSMLALSDQWAAATTDVEHSRVVAAGIAMLAVYDGPGLDAGVMLVIIATVAISWTQLGSRTFGLIGPMAGILAAAIGLAYYAAAVMPTVRIFILEVAGPVFLAWVFFSARALRRVA